jgi:hypothetical protein
MSAQADAQAVYLQELGGVRREAALEPKQTDDTTDTDILLENVRDSHSSVQQLATSLVTDSTDECCRFPDHTKLLFNADKEDVSALRT